MVLSRKKDNVSISLEVSLPFFMTVIKEFTLLWFYIILISIKVLSFLFLCVCVGINHVVLLRKKDNMFLSLDISPFFFITVIKDFTLL